MLLKWTSTLTQFAFNITREFNCFGIDWERSELEKVSSQIKPIYWNAMYVSYWYWQKNVLMVILPKSKLIGRCIIISIINSSSRRVLMLFKNESLVLKSWEIDDSHECLPIPWSRLIKELHIWKVQMPKIGFGLWTMCAKAWNYSIFFNVCT